MSADRAEYLRRLIMARAPELTDADLALLATEPDDALPRQIAEQVLEVIDRMIDRLDALEAMMMNEDDDAEPQRSHRRA